MIWFLVDNGKKEVVDDRHTWHTDVSCFGERSKVVWGKRGQIVKIFEPPLLGLVRKTLIQSKFGTCVDHTVENVEVKQR